MIHPKSGEEPPLAPFFFCTAGKNWAAKLSKHTPLADFYNRTLKSQGDKFSQTAIVWFHNPDYNTESNTLLKTRILGEEKKKKPITRKETEQKVAAQPLENPKVAQKVWSS